MNKLRHEPALDGLRGLAVAGVVLFHARFSWAIGGYLGVSTFFTLSGFLITSVLLAERASTGRIDLPRFWVRRARRLLPAALATLFGVALLAPALGTPDQLAGLRSDVLACLGYVANWRYIISGRSYAAIFSAPSPVLHFWSLAIEEQLYLVFPVLVVAVGQGRRRLGSVVAALIVGSVALSFLLYTPGGSTSAAYYGTGVRAGELLIGALLAVLVASGLPTGRSSGTRTVGLMALVVILWLWATTRQDETWLYRGGFVLHAALSALVVAACLGPGPVRWALSLAPLRALGRISYGIYLYHWPVFVWLDAPVAIQVAVTLALAATSYLLLEQPIREQRWRVPLIAAPAGALVVAAAIVIATIHVPSTRFDLARATPSSPPVSPVATADNAPVVAMFGDSTALRTGFALKGYGWRTGKIDMRDGGVDVGCPLVVGGVVDFVAVRVAANPACSEWPQRWRGLARREHLDGSVVQIGPWDVTDRKLDGQWTRIGEPDFDERLEREMNLAVDVLSASGGRVIWLTAPHIDFARAAPRAPKSSLAHISDPTRIDRLNELIATVDADRREMTVVDLAGHLQSLPGGEMDRRLRPDGVHFSERASGELSAWLAKAIVDALR